MDSLNIIGSWDLLARKRVSENARHPIDLIDLYSTRFHELAERYMSDVVETAERMELTSERDHYQ